MEWRGVRWPVCARDPGVYVPVFPFLAVSGRDLGGEADEERFLMGLKRIVLLDMSL